MIQKSNLLKILTVFKIYSKKIALDFKRRPPAGGQIIMTKEETIKMKRII
ncbi:unnamed protein product [marine sediment metagenome]|uniref:Uncharacterized protein n=1 Tax=marine sediment metagenome TaxID=412755 RepID=X1QSJ8_9ZZZZ